MNVWKHSMRTNGLLWLLCTAVLYLSVMFMPTGISKSPYIGFVWLGLFSTDFSEFHLFLMRNVSIAACAVTLGWIAQAVLIAVFTSVGVIVSSAGPRARLQHSAEVRREKRDRG